MELIKVNDKLKIENLIYEIRGKQVIFDRDLASLYKTETRIINQIVKRNKERFPEEFCFQLTEDEFRYWKSQIVISNGDIKGLRKNPYVFTEQGVAMLSALLKTNVAIQVSISIINAFVSMRNYISNNLIEQKYINKMVLKHDNDISVLKEAFEKFKPDNNHIFFEGQIYDAYSFLLNIFEDAKESIVIIDNYSDKKLLDLLSKTNKHIIIYSKNMDEELILKYSKQYNNVKIIQNNSFHDRFILIDGKQLYHCGASFKELGKKCFAISRIEDSSWLEKIKEKI